MPSINEEFNDSVTSIKLYHYHYEPQLNILHNEIYRVLGVNAPSFEAYESIPKDLVHVLLGNIDIEKLDQFDDEHQRQAKNILAKISELESVIYEKSAKLGISDEIREKYLNLFASRLKKIAYHFNLTAKPIFSTPDKKREDIAKTLVAHSEVLREIKRKNPPEKTPVAAKPVLLSQSELHLKAVLKEKYVANNVRANVETTLEMYFKAKMTNDVAKKERITNQFVQWIENEKRGGDLNLYFYHGCNSTIAFVYEVYKKLYEGLKASNDWPVFRAQSHYFKEFPTINHFINYYSNNQTIQIDDFEKKYNECALSTNVFLFGNYIDDEVCSVSYMLNNQTLRAVNLEALLSAVFNPFFISKESIAQLLSLHEHYAKGRGGALYQISLPKEEAVKLSYAAGWLGVVNPSYGIYDLVTIFDQLLKDENSPHNQSDYIKNLQARLMLPPDQELKCDFLYCEDKSLPNYNEKLTQATNQILTEILKQLSPKNITHLQADVPLFQHLNALFVYNQLPYNSKEPDTLETLTKAVFNNDDARVVELIAAHPDWKDEVIRGNSYFDNSRLVKVADLMITQSNLQPETIVKCLGSNWLDNYQIDNISIMVIVLSKVTDRLSYILQHKHLLVDERHYDYLFHKLQEHETQQIANALKYFIKNCKELHIFIKYLNKSDKLPFAIEQQNFVKDYIDLFLILKELSNEDRIHFAKLNKSKLNEFDLAQTLNFLVFESNLDVQLIQNDFDENWVKLIGIYNDDQLKILLSKISTELQVELLLTRCNMNPFIYSCLTSVFNSRSRDDKLILVRKIKDKINFHQFSVLLTLVDHEDRAELTIQQLIAELSQKSALTDVQINFITQIAIYNKLVTTTWRQTILNQRDNFLFLIDKKILKLEDFEYSNTIELASFYNFENVLYSSMKFGPNRLESLINCGFTVKDLLMGEDPWTTHHLLDNAIDIQQYINKLPVDKKNVAINELLHCRTKDNVAQIVKGSNCNNMTILPFISNNTLFANTVNQLPANDNLFVETKSWMKNK